MQGDAKFEAHALPHLDAVYRVARRLTRNAHDADDLVQETYLRAYRAFGAFELREYGVKPWLLKILHNAYVNRASREARGPRTADLEQLDVPGEGLSPAVLRLDFEQLDGEVKRAIDALPGDFREVLVLWATMELTYHEIAGVLDIPVGTVMSRLHRARQQLMQTLRHYVRDRRRAASE